MKPLKVFSRCLFLFLLPFVIVVFPGESSASAAGPKPPRVRQSTEQDSPEQQSPGQQPPEQQSSAQQQADAEFQALMNRRAGLLQKWKNFNLEENALFGGKSKKDLRNVVQTQKDIIDLDNRILNAGRMSAYTEKKSEKLETLQRQKDLYGRIDSIEAIKSRFEEKLDAFEKREASFNTRIDRQQSTNRGLSIALVLVTALLLFSLFYNPVRKKR